MTTATKTTAGSNGANGQVQDPADYDPFADASTPIMQGDPQNSQGPTPQARVPKSRFELFTAGEAFEPRLPIKTIIEKLITAGSVNLLVGDGGIGKTYIVLDLATAVV